MAKKKSPVSAKYTKRSYGKTRPEEISYEEALQIVGATFPNAKEMLTVPNTIRCERCVVGVEIENTVLIPSEFDVMPEE